MSISKYHLSLCELFHPYFHGIDNESDPTILQNYIVLFSYSFEDVNEEDDDEIEEKPVISLLNTMMTDIRIRSLHRNRIPTKHPIIQNYLNITKRGIRPEITHNIILSGGETVAVIKTFWIRIIQRAWRKKYSLYRKHLWNVYMCSLRGKHIPNKPILLLRGLLLKK